MQDWAVQWTRAYIRKQGNQDSMLLEIRHSNPMSSWIAPVFWTKTWVTDQGKSYFSRHRAKQWFGIYQGLLREGRVGAAVINEIYAYNYWTLKNHSTTTWGKFLWKHNCAIVLYMHKLHYSGIYADILASKIRGFRIFSSICSDWFRHSTGEHALAIVVLPVPDSP